MSSPRRRPAGRVSTEGEPDPALRVDVDPSRLERGTVYLVRRGEYRIAGLPNVGPYPDLRAAQEYARTWLEQVREQERRYLLPMPAYEIISHRLPAGVHYQVNGLLNRFYDTLAQAEEGALLLQRKRDAETVDGSPRVDGQVYRTAEGNFRFHPCLRLFTTWDEADEASRAYLSVLGLDDMIVETVLYRITRGESCRTAPDVLDGASAVPRADWERLDDRQAEEATDASWRPVTRLCHELREPLNLGTLMANVNRAYSGQSGSALYYSASLMAVMGLLTTLASDPQRYSYDISDVYRKLSMYSMWVSVPPLESLRRLHALLTPRVFGTPAGIDWDLDPFPALTEAQKRLDLQGQGEQVYRKIRPDPIARREDGVS